MLAKLTFHCVGEPSAEPLAEFANCTRTQAATVRSMLQHTDYVAPLTTDTELDGMTMLMDLALIFGFAVLPVLPLLCIAYVCWKCGCFSSTQGARWHAI